MIPLIKVNDRIKETIKLVPKCKCLFDVGCDHGKLGAYAFFKGVAENVVFSDISECNLAKAKDTTKRFPQGNLDFLCVDGIPEIAGKPDNVVLICGLGAETIIQMLRDFQGKHKVKFVLQPASKEELLRKYLIQEDFEIIKEVIIKYGAYFYPTMLVSFPRIKSKVEDEAVYLGFVDDCQPRDIYEQYLKKKLKMVKQLINAQKRQKIESLSKIKEYQLQYKNIEERIKGE